MKKIINILFTIILVIAMLPTTAFAETQRSDTWIAVSYSGKLSVTLLNGSEFCENDLERGQIWATQEGKITIEVQSRQKSDRLESILVKSGAYSGSLDDVTYDCEEEAFQADENGIVTVSINLKKGNAYLLGETWNQTWIAISYDGGIELFDINGVPVQNDAEWGKAIAYKEGIIHFDAKTENQKNIKILSGAFSGSLNDVEYNTNEGIFKPNASGIIKVSLDLKKDKAYVIWSTEEEDTSSELKDVVAKIKPSVSTVKTAKGIKVNLKTSGSSMKDIKANGGKLEYKIYRATAKNGKYVLKKTTTAKSYTDRSVKKGKKYYYKVRLYVKDASGTIIQSTSLAKSNVAVRVYK